MNDLSKQTFHEDQPERELVELFLGGDHRAGNRLAKSLFPLVWDVAHEYGRRCEIEPEGLFSAGLEGLANALARLDISRMSRVGSYAKGWITGAIVDECWRITNVVDLPPSKRKLVGIVKKELKSLTEGRLHPSTLELSERTGIDLEKVEEGMGLLFHFISLDQEIKDGSRLTLLDVLSDSDSELLKEDQGREGSRMLSDEDSMEIEDAITSLGRNVLKDWLCLVGVSKNASNYEAGPRLIIEKIKASKFADELCRMVRKPEGDHEDSCTRKNSFVLIRHRWLLKYGRPLVPDM